MPQYYREAVSEHDLAPIADPDIDLDEFIDEAPLMFTAEVEIRPRLELTEADYTGLKVRSPGAEVTDEDVDEWIERLRDRFAELEPVERPVIDGDYVMIDLKAIVNDEEIDELTRTDFLYFVGSGDFAPISTSSSPVRRRATSCSFRGDGPAAARGAGERAVLTVLVKDVKLEGCPRPTTTSRPPRASSTRWRSCRDDLRTRLTESKEREATEVLRDRVLDAMLDAMTWSCPTR